MKRAFLESMEISKEDIDKIINENSADIGKERGKVEIKQEKITELQGEILKRDAKIKTFEDADIDGLQTKLTKLQQDYDTDKAKWEATENKRTHEERRSVFFGDTSFMDDYTKRGIMAEFDERGFEYDEKESTFKGADEWLKTVKETTPMAFMDKSKIPHIIGKPDGNPGNMSISKEQFKKMTYMDKLKIKNEQPDVYKTLKTAEQGE
ncbi:MAG: hypothetical protein RR335_06930 [Eubacterium sp.]